MKCSPKLKVEFACFLTTPEKKIVCFKSNLFIISLLKTFVLGIMEKLNFQWHPAMKMMSDWEKAERNAWNTNFDVPLLGCLSHFGET